MNEFRLISVVSRARAARIVTRAAMIVAVSGVAGCGLSGWAGAPAGQVEAHVNGHDVTERAVDAELAAANLGAGDPAIARATLDKVIARELIVQEAQRAGLDTSPDYLAFKARAEQLVLADMIVKRWAVALPSPSADDIDRYVAANPLRFDQRALLQVDAIEAPGGAVSAAELAPLHSQDAIAALLNQRHVKFQRVGQVLDTALIEPALAHQLSITPTGEPVLAPNRSTLQTFVVTQRAPAPIAAEMRARLATDALRQTAIMQKLATLKAGAKITYRADLQPDQTAPK